jgi:hypothetical protein
MDIKLQEKKLRSRYRKNISKNQKNDAKKLLKEF